MGGNPAPPAEARRGVGKVSVQTRPACSAEALPTRQAAREAGSRRDGGAGIYECMTGRSAQASERPTVQVGKVSGELQLRSSCTHLLYASPRKGRCTGGVLPIRLHQGYFVEVLWQIKMDD